jgi:hypothetical protein
MTDLSYPTSVSVVERLTDSLGLPEASIERLIAIPVVLDALIRHSSMDGYALAGPAALHGVYLSGPYVQRVPDELTFAPVRTPGRRLPSDGLLAAAAASLPGGSATTVDALGRATVSYRGLLSRVEIPLRIEGELVFEPDRVVRARADECGTGFIRDATLPYRGPSGETVVVRTALMEELLARTLLALLDKRRSDSAARTDDLRVVFSTYGRSARDVFAGPIRTAFLAQMAQAPNPEAGLSKLADKMHSMVSNSASDGSIDPSLRSIGATGDWSAFEDAFIDALNALRSGR